jgi:hypothetical protein
MNWPRLFSVGAHVALIAWLYYLSTLPLPPLVTPVLMVDLVQPVYKPPPPPPLVKEAPKELPKEPAKPKRARVRPRAAPPPPPSPEPTEVAPRPSPPAPPPADAPIGRRRPSSAIRSPSIVSTRYPERAPLQSRRRGRGRVHDRRRGTRRDIRVTRSSQGVSDRAAIKALQSGATRRSSSTASRSSAWRAFASSSS